MKAALPPFQLHVDRFGRWHALLFGFDALVAAAALWTAWLWHDRPEVATMGSLAVAAFLMVLTAQVPYWRRRSFTLIHGGTGWQLLQDHRVHTLAEVRAVELPGQLLVLALSDEGRVVLPVSSAIPPPQWRELRTRLAL